MDPGKQSTAAKMATSQTPPFRKGGTILNFGENGGLFSFVEEIF